MIGERIVAIMGCWPSGVSTLSSAVDNASCRIIISPRISRFCHRKLPSRSIDMCAAAFDPSSFVLYSLSVGEHTAHERRLLFIYFSLF